MTVALFWFILGLFTGVGVTSAVFSWVANRDA
jgi:hypothetical protein